MIWYDTEQFKYIRKIMLLQNYKVNGRIKANAKISTFG